MLNIKENDLIKSIKGGINEKRGTWVHQRVAISLAQWISVDFDIFVGECIEEWKESSKKNDKKYYDELNNIKGDFYDKPEKEVRDKLCEELGGEIEVKTPDGFIDILTKKEIIEVKCMKNWKHAIGQILVYGEYYPDHQKRIHLFNIDDILMIESLRKKIWKYGIIMSYTD